MVKLSAPPAFAKNNDQFVELKPIKLEGNRQEKQVNEKLSDLFSIIVATEHLEKAYVRDAIGDDEYATHLETRDCCTLIQMC